MTCEHTHHFPADPAIGTREQLDLIGAALAAQWDKCHECVPVLCRRVAADIEAALAFRRLSVRLLMPTSPDPIPIGSAAEHSERLILKRTDPNIVDRTLESLIVSLADAAHTDTAFTTAWKRGEHQGP